MSHDMSQLQGRLFTFNSDPWRNHDSIRRLIYAVSVDVYLYTLGVLYHGSNMLSLAACLFGLSNTHAYTSRRSERHLQSGACPQAFLCCLTIGSASLQAAFGPSNLQAQAQVSSSPPATSACMLCALSPVLMPEGSKLVENLDHCTQGRLWF